jgi:hypothetical protein
MTLYFVQDGSGKVRVCTVEATEHSNAYTLNKTALYFGYSRTVLKSDKRVFLSATAALEAYIGQQSGIMTTAQNDIRKAEKRRAAARNLLNEAVSND